MYNGASYENAVRESAFVIILLIASHESQFRHYPCKYLAVLMDSE
jgi:hypothetical protein